MNILEKQKLIRKIEDATSDIIQFLEEDRFYPSVREAGTAPTESACDKVQEQIIELIGYVIDSGATSQDLIQKTTFEEIIDAINAVQDKNIADDIDGLKEIDSFVRDNGERKYRYQNTVYEHTPTKRFICVEEQQANGGDFDGIVGSIHATETVKKEIVTYQWS